jgi:hypothetical protein
MIKETLVQKDEFLSRELGWVLAQKGYYSDNTKDHHAQVKKSRTFVKKLFFGETLKS